MTDTISRPPMKEMPCHAGKLFLDFQAPPKTVVADFACHRRSTIVSYIIEQLRQRWARADMRACCRLASCSMGISSRHAVVGPMVYAHADAYTMPNFAR